MTEEMVALDCGHKPAPMGIAPGYAETPSGQKLCYACADNATRQLMSEGNPFIAYADAELRKITSWSGGTLAVIVYVGKVNRATGRHYVTAQDLNGRMWHGQATSGQKLTLRRLRGA